MRLAWWSRPGRSVGLLACEQTQLAFHVDENSCPIVACILPEQPHSRIPGTVGTMEEPAPIRHAFERHPGGTTERAGEMGERGIRRNDEIKRLHDGGRIEKCVWAGIEIV